MKNEILDSLTTYRQTLVNTIDECQETLTNSQNELERVNNAINAFGESKEETATVEAKNPVAAPVKESKKPAAKKPAAKAKAKSEPTHNSNRGRKIDYNRNDGEIVQAVVLEALKSGAQTTSEIINFAKGKKQKVTTFKIQKVAEKNTNVLAERKGNKMIYSLA
jgi:hypothetical protein